MTESGTAGDPPAASAAGHEAGERPAGRQPSALVLVGAAVALLLLGAAGGLLLTVRDSVGTDVPGPDSVAVGFCQDMTVHHRQAVLMASIARRAGDDQRIGTLAYDIETSQLEQIGRMQGWLHLWGRDRLPVDGYMGWMGRDSEHGHGSQRDAPETALTRMPGMATQEELERLRGLEGREFDVLFLQLMLRHHQGGVPMAEDAAERAEVGVVANLAAKMLESQGKEIGYMEALLDEFGAQPLPPPT